MNRFYRLAFAAPLAAAVCLVAPALSANGRFPAADQLIIDPSDPSHIVVRTTFGFMESRDGGKQWLWTCEELIGRIANMDPPFAVTGDGSVIVAVPFEGVSVTHDHGCTWARAPEPLTGQLAVDVTLEPNDPAGMVVLTSTNDTSPDAGPNAPPEFRNLVVETKDNGVTWALRGTPLARDFIASTIEIARSDPNRIYASGVFGDPLRAAIERSEDGGKTWTLTMVPSGELGTIYISAIDPRNADRLYVRVLGPPEMATNATPTTLLESTDKGSTWREVARTSDAMLGFALSPDGTMLAYGSVAHGIFVGSSDGSGPLANVSDVQNRCLTWSPAGLYACGTDLGRRDPTMTPTTPMPDTFAVGLSKDLGKSYDTLYKLYQTCPTVCPDESRFNKVCRAVWEMKPGVTETTRATGETCTVPWAKTGLSDAGNGTGAGGTSGTGGTGGAGGARDAGASGDAGQETPRDDSCTCRLTGAERRRSSSLLALGLAALAWFARTRRSRRRFAR